tara:strand:+ start:1408 stop:1677 length:270 start_codon:yes stop_codon:yes gene_type:complete
VFNGILKSLICKIDITEKVNTLKDVVIFQLWKFKIVESKPSFKFQKKRITTTVCSECACKPLTLSRYNLEVQEEEKPQYMEVPVSHPFN